MFVYQRVVQHAVKCMREVRLPNPTQHSGVISRTVTRGISRPLGEHVFLRNSQQSRCLTHASSLIMCSAASTGPGVVGVPTFQYQPRRHAGHSKWANIRHTKGAKDAQKANATDKIVRQIRIAVRGQYYSILHCRD